MSVSLDKSLSSTSRVTVYGTRRVESTVTRGLGDNEGASWAVEGSLTGGIVYVGVRGGDGAMVESALTTADALALVHNLLRGIEGKYDAREVAGPAL